jgi:hypothetical protein
MMKYLLILALTVACSSKEKKAEAPTPVPHTGAAAEAMDVKPGKSPYTVKNCYCMKIFKPVCADGKNFGNSCEAECQGHKTWTDGYCGKK